jgi:DMSO/TMAO reductase YedYZ heme-binding membrane subunit
MLATSFPPLVRRLRVRLWKPLHRLGYLVAILALDHVLLSPFAPRAITLALFALFFAFGLLRLLPSDRGAEADLDEV